MELQQFTSCRNLFRRAATYKTMFLKFGIYIFSMVNKHTFVSSIKFNFKKPFLVPDKILIFFYGFPVIHHIHFATRTADKILQAIIIKIFKRMLVTRHIKNIRSSLLFKQAVEP